MILSIDTTSEHGSVALTGPSGTLAELSVPLPHGSDHVLFPLIEELLAQCGVQLDQIDCFAATSGPGSFTGVRVGLTTAKGLAEALGKKVVAMSNLQAMASFGTAHLRAPYLDARRGEIFGAVYDNHLHLVQDEVVMKLEAWLASLPAGAEQISAPRDLAAAVGRIAWDLHRAGQSLDPAAIDANYVRRSDADLFWTDPTARPPSSQSK